MTTINNSENLIEKVGGIEKAREIIYQAVGTATNFNVSNNHYAREVLRNRDLVWAWYDRSTQSWFYDFSDQSRVCLNDLRTAIAEHDSREFKVGDLVVYRKQCNLIWDGVYRVDAVLADGRVIERDLPTPKEWLSHATPSEIKAGHRLEAERHG